MIECVLKCTVHFWLRNRTKHKHDTVYVELYCTMMGKKHYLQRNDRVCVEIFCTVLGKEHYVQRHDTICVQLYSSVGKEAVYTETQ